VDTYNFILLIQCGDFEDRSQTFELVSRRGASFEQALSNLLETYEEKANNDIRDILEIFGIKDNDFVDCYKPLADFRMKAEEIRRQKQIALDKALKEKLDATQQQKDIEEFERLKEKLGR
jgi:hypothetical protein